MSLDPSANAEKIRVLVDYATWLGKNRIDLGFVNDVTKGKVLVFPIVAYYKSAGTRDHFYWGNTKDYLLKTGHSHARIVVMGPDNREQFYAFSIYLGDSEVEINLFKDVTHPGFLVENDPEFLWGPD